MNREDGFMEAGILFAVSVISLLTAAFLLYLSGVLSYSASVKREVEYEKEAEDVLGRISAMMYMFAEDDADSPDDEKTGELEREFSQYDFKIADVSSGVNTRLWSETLLGKPAITQLVSEESGKYTVEYGWISVRQPSAKAVGQIRKSFDNRETGSLFPLMNDLALTNIHYVDERFIKAVLEAFGIPRSSEKAAVLYGRIRNETLSETDIADVLGVPVSHGVFAVMGVKTAFWQVKFDTGKCRCEAVYAAIPDKYGEQRKIQRYELLERRITYVGG